jgi:hypothetical protein
MTIDPSSSRRFDVALSFPGEHRPFMKEVAEQLAAAFGEARVLCDDWYDAEFARLDLDVELPNLYRKQSELIALFLYPDYKDKRWCRLELRAIRQLIATVEAKRIMLFRNGHDVDFSDLGIYGGDGSINLDGRTAKEIAEKICKRFYINHGTTPQSAHPSTLSQAGQKSPPSRALLIWQERLEFLHVEEAKGVDLDLKFRLHKSIEEAKAKIREHGGHA